MQTVSFSGLTSILAESCDELCNLEVVSFLLSMVPARSCMSGSHQYGLKFVPDKWHVLFMLLLVMVLNVDVL